MLHRLVATASLVVLALALGVPTLAQEQASEGEPTQTAPGMAAEAEPPTFTDDQLEAFVDVAVDVQSVIAEARPKLAAAESQEESQALVQQTNEKIMSLIQDHPGIAFDEYRAIAMRTEKDPEFKSRVDGMVREAMQDAMEARGMEGAAQE